jgi:hypothetical protein
VAFGIDFSGDLMAHGGLAEDFLDQCH